MGRPFFRDGVVLNQLGDERSPCGAVSERAPQTGSRSVHGEVASAVQFEHDHLTFNLLPRDSIEAQAERVCIIRIIRQHGQRYQPWRMRAPGRTDTPSQTVVIDPTPRSAALTPSTPPQPGTHRAVDWVQAAVVATDSYSPIFGIRYGSPTGEAPHPGVGHWDIDHTMA